MRVSAIVLAAGRGIRFSTRGRKLFSKIKNKPLFQYSLEELDRHSLINEIIIVVNSANRSEITRRLHRCGLSKVVKIVSGGRRRQDSVYNGLGACGDDCGLVLIHDGARPFIDSRLISSVIKRAQKSGAAIAGVPVKSTIKSASRAQVVEKTLERAKLWEIQTPQAFKIDKLLAAYRRFAKTDVTDDSTLVEKLGVKVSIVAGDYRNIKVTTVEDLEVARAIIRRNPKLKTLNPK